MGIYEQIKTARKQSTGNFQHFKKCTEILFKPSAKLCFILALIPYAIGSITLGATSFHQCVINGKIIPIFLMVNGVVTMLNVISTLIAMDLRRKGDQGYKFHESLVFIYNIFLFLWMFTGLIAVCATKDNVNFSFDTSPMHCPRSGYFGAISYVAALCVYHIVVAVITLGICFVMAQTAKYE